MASTRDAKALRAARKARIAARKAEAAKTAASTEETKDLNVAESAFNYNPLYQKPTSMDSNKPRGGYHYFGPPPDAGTSYGTYATSFGGLIAPLPEDEAKASVFDPASGKQAKLEGKADKDLLATVLAAKSELQPLPPCPSCKTVNVTSARVLDKPYEAFHCAACGDDMTKRVNAMKAEMKKNAAPAAPEADAVRFEALSSVDTFDDLVESDVHMTLFDDESANPYWNVDVKGMPVARIYLKDQPTPDETRAVFTDPQYYHGVAGAVARMGLGEVLAQLNAKLWANEVNETAHAKELRASVEAEVEAAHAERVHAHKAKLLQLVGLVCAGMDKNFWREEGNPLKEALYASFRDMGLPGASITAAIEDAFRKGSTAYFETVLTKAEKFLNTSEEALSEIEQAISDANVVEPGIPSSEGSNLPVADPAGAHAGNPTDAPTLASRLAQSSMAVSSVPGLSSSGSQGYGSLKDEMKSRLKLGGANPRRS